MTVLRNVTPTPTQVADAWREVFAPVLRAAGGRDARVSAQAVASLAQRDDAGRLAADNLQDFFARTGQQSVSVPKVTALLANELQSEVARVAGSNQRLSLVELRNLPPHLVDDVLHLRGKDALAAPRIAPPRVRFNEEDLYALMFYAASPWLPAETVSAGRFDDDGAGGPKITGVQTANPAWQGVAVDALEQIWARNFVHRLFDAPFSMPGDGALRIGPVTDASSGREGLLVHWDDIDDASFAFFYAKDASGAYARTHEVFLN